MSVLHLDWVFCPEGYRVEHRPVGKTIAEIEHDVIVPETVRRVPTTPPTRVPGVYQRLAEVRSPDDTLKFTRTFGFLHSRTAKSLPLDFILNAAEDMRRLIKLGERGEWEEMWSAFELAKGAGRLELYLQLREYQTPEVQLRPKTLLDAIRIQAVMDLANGAELRPCVNPDCNEWLQIGPNHHRKTAEYHSPVCQKADYYRRKLRRKK